MKKELAEHEKKLKASITGPIKKYMEEKKKELTFWLFKKIEEAIKKLLRKLKPEVKEALTNDPDMWGCVKSVIHALVDEFYPEIEAVIIDRFRIELSSPEIVIKDKRPKNCCEKIWNCLFCWWHCLRNCFVYAMYPCFLFLFEANFYKITVLFGIKQRLFHFGFLH